MMTRAHKVCMLGDFGVGKTSLVARFMRNTFSDRYLTTVGVKVDSKEVDCGEQGAVKLVVWDIAGGSALDALNMSYLRGAGGLLLVADGTRASTMRTAIDLLLQSRSLLPDAHAVLIVNKLDLVERWEVAPGTLADLRKTMPVIETSALSGDSVEAAFTELARRLAA